MALVSALRLCLGALVVAALALGGLAHRAPDAGLERFLAAGGDLSAICADGEGPVSHHDTGPCDACRLLDATCPARAANVHFHVGHARFRHFAQPLPRGLGRIREPAGGPRAPPRA